jgi:hypothetical protein
VRNGSLARDPVRSKTRCTSAGRRRARTSIRLCARRRPLRAPDTARGIQERNVTQIENNTLDPSGCQRLDLFADLADRVDIDLAERAAAHDVAFHLHHDSKRRGHYRPGARRPCRATSKGHAVRRHPDLRVYSNAVLPAAPDKGTDRSAQVARPRLARRAARTQAHPNRDLRTAQDVPGPRARWVLELATLPYHGGPALQRERLRKHKVAAHSPHRVAVASRTDPHVQHLRYPPGTRPRTAFPPAGSTAMSEVTRPPTAGTTTRTNRGGSGVFGALRRSEFLSVALTCPHNCPRVVPEHMFVCGTSRQRCTSRRSQVRSRGRRQHAGSRVGATGRWDGGGLGRRPKRPIGHPRIDHYRQRHGVRPRILRAVTGSRITPRESSKNRCGRG